MEDGSKWTEDSTFLAYSFLIGTLRKISILCPCELPSPSLSRGHELTADLQPGAIPRNDLLFATILLELFGKYRLEMLGCDC